MQLETLVIKNVPRKTNGTTTALIHGKTTFEKIQLTKILFEGGASRVVFRNMNRTGSEGFQLVNFVAVTVCLFIIVIANKLLKKKKNDV